MYYVALPPCNSASCGLVTADEAMECFQDTLANPTLTNTTLMPASRYRWSCGRKLASALKGKLEWVSQNQRLSSCSYFFRSEDSWTAAAGESVRIVSPRIVLARITATDIFMNRLRIALLRRSVATTTAR